MELIYAVAALASAVAAILAWVAKLVWAKEYVDAKEEVIKAKDAQILVLREQLDNLRELNPMKLREYFLSVRQQLEEFTTKLQDDLEKAKGEISERQKEIEELKKYGATQIDKINKLEKEKTKLQTTVSKIENKVKHTPILQAPITPASLSSYMLEYNLDFDAIGGTWKELAAQIDVDSKQKYVDSFADLFWHKVYKPKTGKNGADGEEGTKK